MWQPSTSAGSSYWTNQMSSSNNVTNTSPSVTACVQNISPARSPGSSYTSPSPSATYHPLTTVNNQQSYHATPSSAPPAEYQNNGSPHYHISSSQHSLAVPPQSHQLYYPSSLSPSHQIYANGNVGFTNFSYAPHGWTHGTPSDYGIFQNTYHYQPTSEYISLINDSRWD